MHYIAPVLGVQVFFFCNDKPRDVRGFNAIGERGTWREVEGEKDSLTRRKTLELVCARYTISS